MIFLTGYLKYQSSKRIILLLCFVFLISFVQAQTGVVNNGAKMIVNSGAVIKITGTGADYTNTSSGGKDGRIDLDGKIELAGDWTNNATSGNVLINANFDGEVVFNGSASQSISGSRASYFEILTLNNVTGISLSANARVVSNLLLTSGIVTLNSNYLTMGVAGTITGGTFSSTKMILVNGIGSLVKLIGSTGSFTFPIGENTGILEYTPVNLTLNSHGGLTNALVSAHVTDAKHPDNNSLSEFLSRYWTLSSSGITSPNYDADFNYLTSDITGTEANIYAAEYDGTTRTVYSTVNTGSNILPLTGMSTFADYTGVDGIVPAVSISTTELNPTNANPIPFKATFSETVNGFVSGDIDVTNGTVSNFNATNNPEFTFDITPVGDGDVTVNVAAGVATDIAGNDNTAADQYTITYDGTSPDVNLTSTVSNPTNNSPFTVKIQFTEKVSGFVVGDISVTNGSAGNLVVIETDSVWTVDITPAGDGTVTVDINAGVATDAAGNGNNAASQFSIDYDNTNPTAVLTSGESSPTNASPFTLTIEFDEGVAGFALSDLTLGNCVAGNFIETKEDTIWTVNITPSGDGTVTVDLLADKVLDNAGNGNDAATQFSITYDGTSPEVTITSAESDPTNSLSFEVTITFNENVSGFDIGDISVGNGSAGNLLNPTPNQVWTADITPSGDGEGTVDIAADVATDAASNGNTAATQFSITYDNTDPTVLTYTPEDEATGVGLSSNLEINFDEIVTTETGNIVLYETGVGPVETFNVTTDIDGDSTATITINPTSDLISLTDYHIQIDAAAFDDEAGNSYAGISDATTWNFTAVDANNPYITETSPIDNAFDVTLTSNLQITLN